MEGLFEKASRLKLRFTHKGMIDVEDLWELDLVPLDKIHMELVSSLVPASSVSLLAGNTEEDVETALKIKIVRHIFDTIQKERIEQSAQAERASKKRKLLGIIAQKQDAELEAMPIEELTKLVNEL